MDKHFRCISVSHFSERREKKGTQCYSGEGVQGAGPTFSKRVRSHLRMRSHLLMINIGEEPGRRDVHKTLLCVNGAFKEQTKGLVGEEQCAIFGQV